MELVDITPINPLISRCVIKVCYVGQEANRNGSIITKEVATKMANSLPGSPIVGFYNETKEDFEEHNAIIDISNGEWKFKDTTRPYGFVDLNARVWFQKFIDDNETEREYLVTEGFLWTGQYPEAKRVIEKGNNQSMELDENLTKGSWSFDDNQNYEFFIINEAVISKLCILGEDVEPCFEGARIESFDKIQFSLDEGFKTKVYSLITEMKNILAKGGNPMPVDVELKEDETTPETAEPQVEEKFALEEEAEAVEEQAPEAAEEEAPAAEEEIAAEPDEVAEEAQSEEQPEEEAPVAYVLDEIPEYVELNANYAAAQEKITSLENQIIELNAQIENLNNFKLSIEKEKKTALIDSFYMLSDNDKKDVIDNIDKYSLEDIEAKLSVICVRNRVSFSLDENRPQAMTVDVDNAGVPENDNPAPAWFQRARAVEKEMSN